MKLRRPRLRTIVLATLALVLGVAGWFVWQIGPRNVIGMLRYDQRREGDLVVGGKAPDVELVALDGTSVQLSHWFGERPLVLIFGSFT